MLNNHIAYIVAIVVIAIWGETFVSSKILLSAGLMPADIFFVRFCLAYLCMTILSHHRLWADTLQHELRFMLLGLFGGSLYFLTENMALKFSTASNVAIIVGTTPIVTALILAYFYPEERMSKRQIGGSLVAFVGLVLVVLNGQLLLHLNPIGDILALCASLTWGVYSLVIKKLSSHYDAKFITRKVFAYGLITILPWFLFVQPLHISYDTFRQPEVWGNILYLGIVASMLCFVAWNWAMQRLGIVRATNIIYTQSIFTMIISYFVLHEKITIMAVCGTLILIYGMILMNKKKRVGDC